MKAFFKTTLCLVTVLAMGLVSDNSTAEDGKMLKKASNGVEIDISRPYYDSDPTVIQEKLMVLEFPVHQVRYKIDTQSHVLSQ